MTVTVEGPSKPPVCKAHIKDICFTRMYITNHFDAPFEGYRLDSAVYDLVAGTGVPRASLLPLTCFLFKGYLWTINNRRLWVLRHAFQFTGRDEEVDVVVLPDTAYPERKDYVARLPFHKQAAMAAPKFLPIIHGDQPKLQKLVMKSIVFRFELTMRNGYRVLPGGRLLCINASEAAVAFQATGMKLPPPAGSATTHHHPHEDDDDTVSMSSETPSMASLDFPGKAPDYSTKPCSWAMPPAINTGKQLALAPVSEAEDEEGGEEDRREGGGAGNKDVAEIAAKFKAAVQHLKVVLNELDAAFDKLAA